NSIDSEYINFAGGKGGTKNCYLYFNSGEGEDSMYCRGVRAVRLTGDVYFGVELERCYEIVNGERCVNVSFSQNIEGCIDSSFLYGSSGCINCFGCVNIRHGKYLFMNKQLSGEQYKNRVSEIRGSYGATEDFKKQFNNLLLGLPHRASVNLKTVDSTGDFLFETRNIRNSFEVARAENGKFMYFAKNTRDSYDVVGFGYDSELLLETVGVGYTSRSIGCVSCDNSRNIEYSIALKQSNFCIGCDGLRNAKLCILNRPYSQSEYDGTYQKIVEELKSEGIYGLSFPRELAMCAYNETIGQDNMPLTPEQAKKYGMPWQDEVQITTGKETLSCNQIPDHINDVNEGICQEILACISCGRNYKIIPTELRLYKQLIVPIPRKCFFCRHRERITSRGPLKLFERFCAKCGKTISTTYAPDRPEIVYCESCYNAEVA
ncbi:MAG: hypothetical protein V1856_00835, partial [Candidatus Liptonbacteria bacterium]